MGVGRLAAGAVGVGIAVFAGAGAIDDDTTRDDSGAIVESGGLGAFVMQVGDCFNEPEEELVVSVEGVPCSQAHDGEVFYEFDLTGWTEFPGYDVFAQDAWDGCFNRFEGYVGNDYQSSSLDVANLTPSQESWAEGDRTVTCFLVSYYGEDLVGSAYASGW